MNYASSSAAANCRPTQCWICGATGARRWKDRSIQIPLEPEDLRITDHRYGATLSLVKCAECSFIFSDDDDLTRLVSLYEKMSDPEYQESQEGRALQMRWLLSKAKESQPSAHSLLDVGAGCGLLVSEAKKIGFEAVGVEPSRWLVELAQRLYEVDLIQGVFPHPRLLNRRFDVISLVDIIEHVSTPLQLLQHCAAALAPRGRILLVTPNVSSLMARLLGQRWWHLRIAHVGYFNESSLSKAAEQVGLEIVEQFSAKWFFRIGYLAERLESYLPVRPINRLCSKSRTLRSLYDCVIPLNLHDSIVLILRLA